MMRAFFRTVETSARIVKAAMKKIASAIITSISEKAAIERRPTVSRDRQVFSV
jgi:hypothetical protein